MSLNKVMLLGNLGSDPIIHNSDKGKTLCTFDLATDYTYYDSEKNRKTITDWHHIICFGSAAERCSKYLNKGRQLFVEGRLQTQKWHDTEGQAHTSNRIIASRVQFLGANRAKAELPVEDVLSEDSEAPSELSWDIDDKNSMQ